jgi:hypothetical protein
MDYRAYTFCVLHRLYAALRRRDVFVRPSWRYADPRAGLLTGLEWEVARPIICRTLGLTPDPEPVLKALSTNWTRPIAPSPRACRVIQRFGSKPWRAKRTLS